MATLLDKRMEATQQMLVVMQAFLDGKVIATRFKETDDWHVIRYPQWNWVDFDYKVEVQDET